MPPRNLVVILAGPTGVGKSAVAAKLCEKLQGLIVSADSVQAYRQVQIGANKPTPEERKATPHLLVDVVGFDHPTYNAAEWTRDAHFCIQELLKLSQQNQQSTEQQQQTTLTTEELKRREEILASIQQARTLKDYNPEDPVVPVVVGGTMMYLQWLVHGRPDAIRPTPEAISRAVKTLEPFIASNDWEGSLRHLREKGVGEAFVAQAATLSANDWYRLRRILEVAFTTSEGSTEHAFSGERRGGLLEDGKHDVRCFFLCPDDRLEHAHLINDRCEKMILDGLISETANLELPEMICKAIGYRQTLDFLQADNPTATTSFDHYLNDFQGATRRYAKRQMQWFRKEEDFVFVPVALNNTDRIQQAANQVLRLIDMSRADFDQERRNPESAHHRTRKRNEQQAKKMKTLVPRRSRLLAGSEAEAKVLVEVTDCVQRYQRSNLARHHVMPYKRPNTDV